MNAYAILMVNEHMESLRAEAAKRRVTKAVRPSLRQRVAAAVENARQHATDTYSASSFLPKLEDYPYRG